jgi:hypothetical protein
VRKVVEAIIEAVVDEGNEEDEDSIDEVAAEDVAPMMTMTVVFVDAGSSMGDDEEFEVVE